MSEKKSMLRFTPPVRTQLAAALRARNNTGILLACAEIPAPFHSSFRQTREITAGSSLERRLRLTADRGIGVLIRTGMVNASLHHNGVDTSRAEELVMKGKTQIIAVRNLSYEGNVTGARASLSNFQKILLALRDIQNTLRDVRDIYRRILSEENLPQPAAQGVLSVIQALDSTATQMGTF